MLADKQKVKFISSVQTLDAIKRTYREQLPIRTDGKRESRESVVSVYLVVDDDDLYQKINFTKQ